MKHIVKVLQMNGLLLHHTARQEHAMERLLISLAPRYSAMFRDILLILCDLEGTLSDIDEEYTHMHRRCFDQIQHHEMSILRFDELSCFNLQRLNNSLELIIQSLSAE